MLFINFAGLHPRRPFTSASVTAITTLSPLPMAILPNLILTLIPFYEGYYWDCYGIFYILFLLVS